MRRIFNNRILRITALALLITLSGCISSRSSQSRLDAIKQRKVLLVGSTGDYRPMSYIDTLTGMYWGFDVDLANLIGEDMGVEVQFVKTSWPTLSKDMQNGLLFDMAISGITITDSRKETMLMSDGYLHNGKTILCRVGDFFRFQCLDDINSSDVRVMFNPGGTNEKFANEHLTKAKLIVHQKNEEIPSMIAEGAADVMITEVVEAAYYIRTDGRLAAPLIDRPFNETEMGILIRKEDDELLEYVNGLLKTFRDDGTLEMLHEKYGLQFVR